jgi:Zn-dependent protease/predicted transcriptional regulator
MSNQTIPRTAFEPVRDKSAARPRSLLGPGVRVGKLFGFEISLDVSLLLIFALVLFNLGLGLLPAWHPDWSAPLRWAVATCAALLLFVSILLHELSHALVGRALGTPVSGITLFMFGGMAHLEREPKRASAELWMAIAGPITSLVIGVGASLLGGFLAARSVEVLPEDPLLMLRNVGPVATLLLWLGPLNVMLALFNMLPGFPLDGGRVLRALVWWKTGNLKQATLVASTAGLVLSWTMIAAGVSMALGLVLPVLGGGFGQGLWLILIGWFLGHAARASYGSLVATQALEHVAVSDLMWTRPEVATPGQTIRNLIEKQVLHSDQQLFPVVRDGAVIGAVALADIRNVPEHNWDTTPIDLIMKPKGLVPTVSPDTDATKALSLLDDTRTPEIPVVDQDRLLGLVRRQDLLRWLSVRLNPESLGTAA